jgi:hypothetical protein
MRDNKTKEHGCFLCGWNHYFMCFVLSIGRCWRRQAPAFLRLKTGRVCGRTQSIDYWSGTYSYSECDSRCDIFCFQWCMCKIYFSSRVVGQDATDHAAVKDARVLVEWVLKQQETVEITCLRAPVNHNMTVFVFRARHSNNRRCGKQIENASDRNLWSSSQETKLHSTTTTTFIFVWTENQDHEDCQRCLRSPFPLSSSCLWWLNLCRFGCRSKAAGKGSTASKQ